MCAEFTRGKGEAVVWFGYFATALVASAVASDITPGVTGEGGSDILIFKMQIDCYVFEALLPIVTISIPVQLLPFFAVFVEFGNNIAEFVFKFVGVLTMDVSVGVAKINFEIAIPAFDAMRAFSFAIMPDVNLKIIVAHHGKILSVLISIRDDTGDTMILIAAGEDGGKFFDDTQATSIVFGFAEIKVGLVVLKIEIIGIGCCLGAKNRQKSLTN